MEEVNNDTENQHAIVEFTSSEGITAGSAVSVPLNSTRTQLAILLNQTLGNNEAMPYSFWVGGSEMQNTLSEVLQQAKITNVEQTVQVVYLPQALFRVAPVRRCSAELTAHDSAILCAQFSPDGILIASGAGKGSIHLWDMNTELHLKSCVGHLDDILSINWSSDAKKFVSGDKSGILKVWDRDGKVLGTLKSHIKWITCTAWEPFHINYECRRLLSGSKDQTIKIWDSVLQREQFTLSGHKSSVTCALWGCSGRIYSGSQDGNVYLWDSFTGQRIDQLGKGNTHSHWVNTMALNTDFVLRVGAFDEMGIRPEDPIDAQEAAFNKLEIMLQAGDQTKKKDKKIKTSKSIISPQEAASLFVTAPERVLTGSDDFTLCLWDPRSPHQPISKFKRHNGVVNSVAFSPDGRYIASASFDKTIMLWDGISGRPISTLRGHVGRVYQVRWSADSRLIVSCSEDSTGKVWEFAKKQLLQDLPGHSDAVYVVDWSPNGERVCSGGKDRALRICNKLTCSCGAALCYNCRMPLDPKKPYDHFKDPPI